VRKTVSRYWWVVALVGSIVVVANLPDRVQIGQMAERTAEWWNPTKPRMIQRAKLGPKKQAIFDRLKRRSEEAKAESANLQVPPGQHPLRSDDGSAS
jgi:hypothetical protein